MAPRHRLKACHVAHELGLNIRPQGIFFPNFSIIFLFYGKINILKLFPFLCCHSAKNVLKAHGLRKPKIWNPPPKKNIKR